MYQIFANQFRNERSVEMNLKDSLFLEVPEKLLVVPLVYTPTVGYREDKRVKSLTVPGICSNNTIKHHVFLNTLWQTLLYFMLRKQSRTVLLYIYMWYHYIIKINLKVVRIKILAKAKTNLLFLIMHSHCTVAYKNNDWE